VGVAGLKLNRADFYEKELSFQVSCSYGPGRYDPAYEQGGRDYPYGFVRWTERRNMEAVLALMAEGRLDAEALVSERMPFAEAAESYRRLAGGRAIGTVFTYGESEPDRATAVAVTPGRGLARQGQGPGHAGGVAVVGAIGAGQFARYVQFPLLKRAGARRLRVADLDPVAARHAAGKFGFETAGTDYRELLADEAVNAVFVTVPHHLHAPIAAEALAAGKCVHVEKPLAIDLDGVRRVREALAGAAGWVTAGFNRRFSPHARRMRELLAARTGPLSTTMTVNAGAIPPDHWIQNPAVGGGRIIGEGCHFVDTLRFLAGACIERVRAAAVSGSPDGVDEDKTALVLDFADGSLGVINYFASGHKAYPKERLEAFCDGKVLALNNFRQLRGHGWRRFRRMVLRRQDKGHRGAVEAFLRAVASGGPAPIPYDEVEEVTLATFAAVRSMREGGRTVPLEELRAELEAAGH